MSKKSAICLLSGLAFAASAIAHDMFLKMPTFFLAPNSDAKIALINGTFDKSENVITRDRMIDVSIAAAGQEKIHPDESMWSEADNTTYLAFKTGDPGTYLIGVSTAANSIDLKAAEFNDYLHHDGILDTLEARKKEDELGKDARELYAKHVKAIVQVGDKQTDNFGLQLDYPVEIIPVQNPYHLKPGDVFKFQALSGGKPLPGQLVYASNEHHKASGDHAELHKLRTDDQGMAEFRVDTAGRWYVRFINMVESKKEDFDYESQWATLTFEIR